MRSATRAVLLGGCLLALAAVLVFLWAETDRGRFLLLAVTAFCLGGVAFAAGARRRTAGRDPLELRREQRLWRSGPLGRSWLKSRRRLP